MGTDAATEAQASGFASPCELLAALAGEWRGVTRTWFEPDQLADESEWRGSIRLALDGKFAVHEYVGTLCGEALKGHAVYGYNKQRRRWEMAWCDSTHNGSAIMYSSGGEWPEGQRAQSFSVLGSYPDGQGGPEWGWRTEVSVESPDRIAVRHYNITPGGEESIAVETVYERV